MKKNKYGELWLAFIHIKAKKDMDFNDLIDNGSDGNGSLKKFVGAWANVLVKASTLKGALEIVPSGIGELGFEIEFIDKIENLQSLFENNALKEDVIDEADWLLASNYVFKISDRIFPYCND